MNIVNKLTLRHMLLNKRRTIVTIMGVIISVAMISAVVTLGLSFLDLFKRETIAREGNWHIQYPDVPASKLDIPRNSPYADELLLEHDKGFGLLSELGLESTEYKPYVFVREYNPAAFDKMPVTLLEGRLPQQEGEVVVPEHYAKLIGSNADVIGKSITLNLGERFGFGLTEEEQDTQLKLDINYSMQFDEEGKSREKLINMQPASYTIVGVIEHLNWEYTMAPGYSFLAYLNEASLQADDLLMPRVYSANPDKGIFADAERMSKELDVTWYNVNSDLLRYQFVSSHDGFIFTLYSLLAIVMLVIIIGSISLIYNAFGISVADRSRYLGMLASVGATRRQKRNSVLFEGLIISAISIPLGICSALLGLAITFSALNPLLKDMLSLPVGLEIRVNIWTILVSIAISLLTILLSVWWPAKRAAKVSAIDAIRQSQDVKLSRKQVKTSKLTRKLFGLEAEIAMKNIKRNKRRYQITIFSLVISIILFLTVSCLTDAMKRGLFGASAGVNYDISLYFSEVDDPNLDVIKSSELLTDYSIIRKLNSDGQVDVKHIPAPAQRAIFGESTPIEDKFTMNVALYGVEEDRLKEIAAQAGVDFKQLMDSSHPQAILYNVNSYYNQVDKRYVTDKSLLQTSDLILPLSNFVAVGEADEDGNRQYETIEYGSVELIGSTEQSFPGIVRGEQGPNTIILLVSNETVEQLSEQGDRATRNIIFMTSDNPMALEKEIRENHLFDSYSMHNVYRNKQEEKGVVVLISVFSYGFISLITLISIANILNTISTGIQLRKREFAMLRSIGMTDKGFYRMINYESILYGVKSLLYGLPISAIIMVLIYRSMSRTSFYSFQIPWLSLGIMLVALFAIVGFAMLYSGSKVKKGSIVEAIKQENL